MFNYISKKIHLKLQKKNPNLSERTPKFLKIYKDGCWSQEAGIIIRATCKQSTGIWVTGRFANESFR